MPIVIRDAQMRALDDSATAGFVRELAMYIRARHGNTIVRQADGEMSAAEVPNGTLEALVRTGIRRASSYGISWRSALASFVVAMFVVAPNFDENAAVRDLLTDSDIEPDYRMDSVWQRITEEQWSVFRQNYDVMSWRR